MHQTPATDTPNQSTQIVIAPALDIDGIAVTESDVRRLIRLLQRANIAFMTEVFSHGRTRQLLARYQADCAYLPEVDLFFVTRAGLDLLDDMERGA